MSQLDRELLIGIARGRDDSARELWARCGFPLTELARTIVGPSAAPDVVQSALCRILECPISRLRAVESALPWLAQIVRNVAANHLRSERRRRSHNQRLAKTTHREPVPPEAQSLSLSERLDSLPRRLREVVVLKLVAGLTFDQLALALGINRNTAAARYRSALDALRIGMVAQDSPSLGVLTHES